MKFIAISDAHIGGKFNEEMFKKGVDFVNKTNADYYIFCGDLTDQGTVAEYDLAKNTYLPMFEKELLMVPGNHDAKNVGDLIWQEYIGSRYFVHTDEVNRVRILGLDSNEPDQNTGRMGGKAIDRIYQEFQDLDEDWMKVLVFHHQTLPIKYTGRERSALVDAGDTIKAIMDCNIDLVLNGHRHISNVYRLTDGEINTLVVNVGTISCKKTRYHEEYSVTTVDIDKKQTKAKIDVLLLNHDKPKWVNKFTGAITDLGKPKNIGQRLSTIIQIGNTDFSDQFDLENFAKASQVINSIDCDLVIHTGDITHGSYRREFELAKTLLSQISKPLIVVPGPRDYYPLGAELYPLYFGDFDPSYEDQNIKVMGFNSCILDEKIGRLGRSRSSQIVDELHKDKRVGVIAFHHTLIPLPRSKHESELQDAGDVLANLVEHHMNLVLTGAKNRSGCWQVDDTIFINAGTLSSHNIVSSRGNSFNIINIFQTDQGKYYKIDEYFVESAEMETIGKFHVRDI
ncbi:MAG: metallophosphoesterase family protein [Candidatus Kariarchaeaceae archaeon]|jgi:3',5'-cyclic AMP phosphodiesterase CpdA